MNKTELREIIARRAESDPEFALAVANRADTAIAKALSVGRVAPLQYLITARGIRRVLGAREGRIFIQSLRAFAILAATTPAGHPAYDDLWWLNELLPDLGAGGAGIDIGDQSTRRALRALAGAVAGMLPTDAPKITSAHCDALEAASSRPDPITYADVGAALSEG